MGVEQLEDAQWRAGAKPGQILRQAPSADRRQTVYVLVREDHPGERRAVEALRDWELEQDAADVGVLVALLDNGCHFVLSGIGGQVSVEVGDPHLGRGLPLVADVDLGRGVIPDQDRGQPWAPARLVEELLYLPRDLRPHPGSGLAAVDDGRGHGPGKARRSPGGGRAAA